MLFLCKKMLIVLMVHAPGMKSHEVSTRDSTQILQFIA